ncbi:MAG: hypothetical protein ACF8QF_01820 [Phycisphaerales bacterium]
MEQQETIRIMCPNVVCKRVLAVPLTARGRQVRCRFCATSIRVPVKKEPPKPAPVENAEDGADEKKPRKGAEAA